MSGRPVVVLGRRRDAEAMAALLALDPGGARVVIHLRKGEAPPLAAAAPGGRGARELAAALGEAGVAATARGGLVVVEGGPADAPADALAARVALACGCEPVVAFLRSRTPQDEPLLERSSVTLCEGVREAAAELLMRELEARRIPVTVRPALAGVAGAIARAGLRFPLRGASPGQASVETLALLPLLLVVVLAAGQLLAAGVSRELAGHAATAGAAALIQGRDGAGAARRALPGWSRARAQVTVRGRRVSVRIRPPGASPVARLLEASRAADAGPAP